MRITVRINGAEHHADCWEGESLLYALREKLGEFFATRDGGARAQRVAAARFACCSSRLRGAWCARHDEELGVGFHRERCPRVED